MSKSIQSVQKQKPLMRGWSHALAAVAALLFTIILALHSTHDIPKMISLIIFGSTMITLYTVSAIYHIGRWNTRWGKILRSFDHANIFLVIAGTYTPLTFNILSGNARIAMLIAIWSCALVGIGMSVATTRLPRWIFPIVYVIMGWIAMFAIPQFVTLVSWVIVVLMTIGGGLYTIGAVVYGTKKPDPFPRVFGYHEIFHLFVIAGGTIMALIVWLYVLPFPRV